MTLKFDNLSVGMKVQDSWWKDWGYGEVIKVLKTRIYVKWWRDEEPMIYDKQHAEQFLIIMKE